MDVREKLVELIGSTEYGNGSLVGKNFQKGFIEKIASNLIANGATVQEWISVKDRLPNEPMRCLVYTKRGEYWGYEITYYNQGFYTQYAEAIYWMPLPQPPKGE